MQDIFSDLDLHKYAVEYCLSMTVQEIRLFSTYWLTAERKNNKTSHDI